MWGNVIVHTPTYLTEASCQSRSSRSFVEHLLESDSWHGTVHMTRFKNNEKSDPILSDLGTLAINSVCVGSIA